MAKVKLFGLVLIITTSILALAAIATQTNYIRIRNFTQRTGLPNPDQFAMDGTAQHPGLQSGINEPGIAWSPVRTQSNHGLVRVSDSHGMEKGFLNPEMQLPPAHDNSVEFISIPIALPLCFSGLLGMMLWFTPMSLKPAKHSSRRSRRRRRR